jgi:hypothetical protein
MKTLRRQTSLLLVLIIFSLSGYTQRDSLEIDSLKKVLISEKEDTNKVNTLFNLIRHWKSFNSCESGVSYFEKNIL